MKIRDKIKLFPEKINQPSKQKKSDFQKQETVRTSVRTTLASNIELIDLPFPLSEMELY